MKTPLELDIRRIQKLAKQKEDENWDFRSYLKRHVDGELLDQVTHELYDRIAGRIDCTACGNCCKQLTVELSPKDIGRLAQALELTPEQFSAQYLTTCEDFEGLVFKDRPCPFLKNNRCIHYSRRPALCVSYPHLQKKDVLFRLMNVVGNCDVCPIVFHVYEGLKVKFRFRR